MEDFLGEDFRFTFQIFRNVEGGNAVALAHIRGEGLAGGDGQHLEDGVDILQGHGLVQRDGEATLAVVAEVDLFRQGHLLHIFAGEAFGCFEAEGVEIVFVVLFETVFGRFGSQHASQHVDFGGFVAQAFGTVPHGVEAGHNGGEGAGSADVGSGFLALYVLLAHLEGHTHGAAAFGVNGDTDDTAGHLALELFGAGVEAGGR